MLVLGVQFFLMGLLAEMLVRTYHESQAKSIYAVARKDRVSRVMSDKLLTCSLCFCEASVTFSTSCVITYVRNNRLGQS